MREILPRRDHVGLVLDKKTHPTGAPEEQLGLLHSILSYSRTLTSANRTRFGEEELLVDAVTEPTLELLTPRVLVCELDWIEPLCDPSGVVTDKLLLREEGVLLFVFGLLDNVVGELPDSETSLL